MTNEEFEKRMEFMIEQQAQSTSDIQRLRESHTQTEQLVGRLASAVLQGYKDVNTKIDALVDSHIRLVDSHARLTEAQSHTDENLRNLIAVVDRYFRERRNGEPAP